MQIRCTKIDHQNQYIIGICVDSNCPYQRPYCHYCLPEHNSHLNRLILLELLNDWILKRIHIIEDVQNNVQECKSVLDNLINKFIPYFNINIEQSGISEIDNLIKGLCKMEICEQQLFNLLKQSTEQIKLIIDEILIIIKSQTGKKQKIDIQVQQPQLIKEQKYQVNMLQPKLKQFTFELMKQNTIKQDEWCNAIAFNKDCSIVIAGCQEKIKVFKHKDGKMNQIQILSKHKGDINTLNFMKNNNNFVSGSDDKLIIIWEMNENNLWYCQQILNEHSNLIYCVLLNNSDDLIISGSCDSKIKFWVKQNQWLCQQTITDHTESVYSLSLNEQQNKLISCSWDLQILVIEQSQSAKKWNVIQNIEIDQDGFRLCFINDYQFIFQPKFKEQMHIYEIDINTKQFQKTKEITFKCCSDDYCFFPSQYLKSQSLLLNKNGKNVYVIQKNENGYFTIEQSIEFGDFGVYGQLSDDGKFLITWDNSSKEIQIRQCQEK
ncbi:unnamed protein product [Paramecium sonneborni]|uniref:WD40-repeat-containing domain n=1 Tax=Paramecium sonneborni TaxID=65129 RepID=A0A8S1LM25_9CILI|nr:unnamed protein product [Paramecium sonneborni]